MYVNALLRLVSVSYLFVHSMICRYILYLKFGAKIIGYQGQILAPKFKYMYFSVLFKFFPSLQLYIYPGTSVVNYVQDESGLDIESRSRNSTEFDLDMLSNQQPENSTVNLKSLLWNAFGVITEENVYVNHAPEPDHHHSDETETDKKNSGPKKHSSPIYHQETKEPHQITHDIHEHHPPHHINNQKPDYKPHQTKVFSQEKQYSEEPHHTPSTHEIHEHNIPHEQSKPDHKSQPTKIVHEEKKPVAGYYQEAHDPHHNPTTHEIHEHHTPHHAVLPIGEKDKNWE